MAEKKKTRPAKAGTPSAKRAARKPAKKVSSRKPSRTSARPKSAPRRASSSTASGFDIAKLIDHPLVADLLAVGAMAAVAAIADHHVKSRTGEAEAGSSKAVKAAGKAAAAVGRRLLTEVNEVKKASKPAKAKRGSK